MSFTLTLTTKKPETSDIETFIFTPNEKIEFTPGQYLRYKLEHPNPDDRGVSRMFSIASSPSEGFIQITTRFANPSSSFKTALRNLEIGTTIEANGPLGNFTLPQDLMQSPQKILPDGSQGMQVCLIAGGIGITPFRSMLKQIESENTNPEITLLFANKSDAIPFYEELQEFAKTHDKFKLVPIVEEATESWQYEFGRISSQIVQKYISDLKNTLFYVSGTQKMVEIVETLLEQELAVPKENTKHDYFPGYTGI